MSLPKVSASTLETIGHTPVVQLRRVVTPDSAEVFVKLESHNPTGSYKDRMALAMIAGAERRGALSAGMRVVEFTGGSTGSSLAFVCAVKAIPACCSRPTRSRARRSRRCGPSALRCEWCRATADG
jgi:cysteine synthase A